MLRTGFRLRDCRKDRDSLPSGFLSMKLLSSLVIACSLMVTADAAQPDKVKELKAKLDVWHCQ